MSTPADLEQNIEAYEAMRETLEKHRLHKLVIVHDAELISSSDNFDNAAREAVHRSGQGPYLSRQVGTLRRIAVPGAIAFRPVHAAR